MAMLPFSSRVRADNEPVAAPAIEIRNSRSVFDVETPRVPAPFIVPDVSHPDPFVGVSWTVGLGVPSEPGDSGRRPASAVGLLRLSAETDVGPVRRLYVGVTYPIAAALPPDGSGGAKMIAGNIEGHLRVTFPQPTWLAAGAALGVVAPTARFDRSGPAQVAATAAASFDPTDAIYFAPGAVALRPAFDVRILRGPFLAQARQGLDVTIDVAGLRVAQTNGRLLGHFGVRARKDLEVSIEAQQLYLFGSNVPDKHRNALTMGPNIRYSAFGMEIGAGFVTNVFSALSPALAQIVGLRLSVLAYLR
ncbi:MAG: hypothetical protein FWD73_01320 [Polyangiaceae bacterium]|nr:hypothetical protein [Polyangiaceae bacterium]